VKNLYFSKGTFPIEYFGPTIDSIVSVQKNDGTIPWFEGGHLDPWDHVESAMGLSIGGKFKEAAKAYDWLIGSQLNDGSWWASYVDGKPKDMTKRESNFSAYIAVGVWHHFLLTNDMGFLEDIWPTVKAAIEFVINLQTSHGEICWACRPDGTPWKDALITGNSSIYKSIECALAIADRLGKEKPLWEEARNSLRNAVLNKPHRFDRTWESKERFAMDWYYPVLSGIITGKDAKKKLTDKWDIFVEEEIGCRCVSDQPWVTVAESCELTLALLSIGEYSSAAKIFSWLHILRDSDGAYWCGMTFPDNEIWPVEKPAWTAAAVLLAADALTEASKACRVLTHSQLLYRDASQYAESISHGNFFKKSGR